MADLQSQLRQYGRDLDRRARLTDGVHTEHATSGIGVEALVDPSRRRHRGTIRAVAAAAAAVVIAVAGAIAIRGSDFRESGVARVAPDSRWRVEIPLSEVPQGISTRRIMGTPVFLVRRGDRVTTLLTDMHHLPEETVLFWCPDEEAFVSPTHGEMFDESGAAIGGPVRAGLDRLETHVDSDTVTIDYAHVVHDPRPATRLRDATFCDDGTRGGGAYRQPRGALSSDLTIDVAPSGAFSASSYTATAGNVRLTFLARDEPRSFRIDDARFAAVQPTSELQPSAVTLRLPPGVYTIASSAFGMPDEVTATLIVETGDARVRSDEESVLPLPPRGSALSALLRDGTPVWVAHDAEGGVSVFDGASTHLPFGVSVLVGWCPQTQSFEDPIYESQWNAQGLKIGGPAPTGLKRYASTIRAGRVIASGAPTVVATEVPPLPEDALTGIPPVSTAPCFDPTKPGYNPGTSERPDLDGIEAIPLRSFARTRRTPITYLIENVVVVAGRDREPIVCDPTRQTCVSLWNAGVTRAPKLGAESVEEVSLAGDILVTVGPNGPERVVFANGYEIS